MSKNNDFATVRVLRESADFINKIRDQKSDHFGIKYRNDMVIAELIELIESDNELVEKLVNISPIKKKPQVENEN